MYDRRSNPFWQLEDFIKKVSAAYDRKNLKDDSSKFAVIVRSLSPKADTELLGPAPNLEDLPDSLDEDER
jgi:hypothetical protein